MFEQPRDRETVSGSGTDPDGRNLVLRVRGEHLPVALAIKLI